MLFHWSLESFLEYGELPIYVNTVVPGEHPDDQCHDHGQSVEIALVKSGSAVHLALPYSAPVRKGDVLLILPGMIHGYRNSADLALENVVFRPGHLGFPSLDAAGMSFFQELFSRKNTPDPQKRVKPILHLQEPELCRIGAIMERIRKELSGNAPGRQFIALAIFMELLLELARLYPEKTLSPNPLWLLGDAVAYMQKNYARRISVEQISRASGVSRRNLFRYFRNQLNCTPLEYLTRLRLQKAQELLVQSELSLGEVALQCGFCDSNYLSKQFSAAYGVSPGKYRREHRKSVFP